MFEMKKEVPLPRLRQDIILNPGPPEPEGAPTWTLYDPGSNKYFKIGWLEFECLVRFNRVRTAPELAALLDHETPLHIEADDVQRIVNFLIQHHLVQANDPAMVEYLRQQKERTVKSWWEQILHGYLYFTIPLFKPQNFLNKTYPFVSFLFTRKFFMGVLMLLGYGIFLTFQRWDEFMTTFMSYMTAEGAFYLLVTTIFVKIIHELGHAYTATKYGVPVPVMGIALMVLYPVLYCETTNGWKLSNRRHRMHISAAGVMAEMALSSVAIVLWHMLPPGIPQSVCFMVGVVSLVASILVNISPFMRFDGYYIFSDLIGVDNLQDRSFAFGRWKLRNVLWGWNDPPPETVTEDRQKLLLGFSYFVWIYRLILYIGIAVMVYHIFLKPLGLILMIVEVGFFILLPIWRELTVWWKERERIFASGRGKAWAVLAVVLFLLSLVPLQSSVEVPAVMHAAAYERIYPPASAKVEEILTKAGKHVEKGEILFMLSSPELEFQIAKAEEKYNSLVDIRNRTQANMVISNKQMTIDAEIEKARKELDGLLSQEERLTVKAPFTGVIRDVNPFLREGQWLGITHLLAVVIDPAKTMVSGYVDEHDYERIKKGATGKFYVDTNVFRTVKVTLEQIDDTDADAIFWPELSTVYGGPIPSEKSRNGVIHPLSRQAYYAVKFKAEEDGLPVTHIPHTTRGVIKLDAVSKSFAGVLGRRVISLFMRESGF